MKDRRQEIPGDAAAGLNKPTFNECCLVASDIKDELGAIPNEMLFRAMVAKRLGQAGYDTRDMDIKKVIQEITSWRFIQQQKNSGAANGNHRADGGRIDAFACGLVSKYIDRISQGRISELTDRLCDDDQSAIGEAESLIPGLLRLLRTEACYNEKISAISLIAWAAERGSYKAARALNDILAAKNISYDLRDYTLHRIDALGEERNEQIELYLVSILDILRSPEIPLAFMGKAIGILTHVLESTLETENTAANKRRLIKEIVADRRSFLTDLILTQNNEAGYPALMALKLFAEADHAHSIAIIETMINAGAPDRRLLEESLNILSWADINRPYVSNTIMRLIPALENLITDKDTEDSLQRRAVTVVSRMPVTIQGPVVECGQLEFPRVGLAQILERVQMINPRNPRFVSRSLVYDLDKGKTLMIKFVRELESHRPLLREAFWQELIWRDISFEGVRWDIPQPLAFDNTYVISIPDLPVAVPDRLVLHPDHLAICAIAENEYFSYPNDRDPAKRVSPEACREILGRCAYLFGSLTARGIIHTDIIPLFHNRTQANRRPDRGIYRWWQMGRLDSWLASCDYPNFGVTGVRDLEHLVSWGQGDIVDGYHDQEGLFHMLGTQMFGLLLVAGSYFRNADRGRRGPSPDLFDRNEFLLMVNAIFAEYYHGFVSVPYKAALPFDPGKLVDRMIKEMGNDQHMLEVLRASDQALMSFEEFWGYLQDRGYDWREIRRLSAKYTMDDIEIMSGPHLGEFNGRISLPEMIDAISAMSALCMCGAWQQIHNCDGASADGGTSSQALPAELRAELDAFDSMDRVDIPFSRIWEAGIGISRLWQQKKAREFVINELLWKEKRVFQEIAVLAVENALKDQKEKHQFYISILRKPYSNQYKYLFIQAMKALGADALRPHTRELYRFLKIRGSSGSEVVMTALEILSGMKDKAAVEHMLAPNILTMGMPVRITVARALATIGGPIAVEYLIQVFGNRYRDTSKDWRERVAAMIALMEMEGTYAGRKAQAPLKKIVDNRDEEEIVRFSAEITLFVLDGTMTVPAAKKQLAGIIKIIDLSVEKGRNRYQFYADGGIEQLRRKEGPSSTVAGVWATSSSIIKQDGGYDEELTDIFAELGYAGKGLEHIVETFKSQFPREEIDEIRKRYAEAARNAERNAEIRACLYQAISCEIGIQRIKSGLILGNSQHPLLRSLVVDYTGDDIFARVLESETMPARLKPQQHKSLAACASMSVISDILFRLCGIDALCATCPDHVLNLLPVEGDRFILADNTLLEIREIYLDRYCLRSGNRYVLREEYRMPDRLLRFLRRSAKKKKIERHRLTPYELINYYQCPMIVSGAHTQIAVLLYNIGIVYTRLGMSDKALDIFNKAAAVNSGLDEVHRELARAYLIKKDFERAAASIDMCQMLDPSVAEYPALKSLIRHLLGDEKAAMEQAIVAMELDAYQQTVFSTNPALLLKAWADPPLKMRIDAVIERMRDLQERENNPPDPDFSLARSLFDGGSRSARLSKKEKHVLEKIFMLVKSYVLQRGMLDLEQQEIRERAHKDLEDLKEVAAEHWIKAAISIMKMAETSVSDQVFVMTTVIPQFLLDRGDYERMLLKSFLATDLGQEFNDQLTKTLLANTQRSANIEHNANVKFNYRFIWILMTLFFARWLNHIHIKRIIEAFAKVRNTDICVLDLGCGSVAPLVCGALGKKELSYIGLDIDPVLTGFNRKASRILRRENNEFVAGLAGKLPLADESIDAVIVGSAEADMHEIRRILKPEGIVLLTCHDMQMVHLIYLAMLNEAGFKIIEEGFSAPWQHTFIIAAKSVNIRGQALAVNRAEGYKGISARNILEHRRKERNKVAIAWFIIAFLLLGLPAVLFKNPGWAEVIVLFFSSQCITFILSG
ncbi:MAG: SidJ-related pseudokinase, partial [Candidatus Omnitrophica bacterium]|nr:SidJ-related pseudokinase [Candidatus Omnitrophota bacterium]